VVKVLERELRGETEDIPEDVLDCDECFGKHSDNCQCTCRTCQRDKTKRDFYAFLEEHPEFRNVLEADREKTREWNEKRIREAEAQAKHAEEEARYFRDSRAWAEEERDEAIAARDEAERRLAEATAAMSPEAAQTLHTKQYYAQIRRELHLGKTDGGKKLTKQMVQERFEKLEERHARLAPRYQATDAETLVKLREKWKDDLADAARDINQHTTSEVAGVHSRLERIEARLEGKLPPRRPDQTATQRKREIDEVLPGLRQERKQLVEEERAEKAAKRDSEHQKSTARGSAL
jgi:hypothetical protein